MPVPFDVKLMNMLATALFVGCGALVLAAGARWAIQHPALNIGRIVVQGEMEHNSAVSLQANVMPALKGNFFTMDLDETRKIFEQAPWVRQARIKREFPHTLSVTISLRGAVEASSRAAALPVGAARRMRSGLPASTAGA